MNRETIIQIAREAGLAEVTDTNQNLRQAEQALLKRYAELVNSGDAGNWYQEAELEVIAARRARERANARPWEQGEQPEPDDHRHDGDFPERDDADQPERCHNTDDIKQD